MPLAVTLPRALLVAGVCFGSVGCGNTTADPEGSAKGDASARDAANDTTCPDGEGYFAEHGCLSCQDVIDKRSEIINQAMSGAKSCSESYDCQIVGHLNAGDCYYDCVEAFSHAGAKAVKAALEEAGMYCMCGGPLHPPLCPDVEYAADCVDGVCTVVPLTDGGDP